MESLPFIIRQGADVAIEGESLLLKKLPGRHQLVFGVDQGGLGLGQVLGLDRRVRVGGPAHRSRRGRDDLLERLVLQPDLQDQVALRDLVIQVLHVHVPDVGADQELDRVLGVLQRPAKPLIIDQGGAEVVAFGHPDQGKLRVQDQLELLGLIEESKRVGRQGGGEDLVGDRDVQHPFQGIRGNPDLPPRVVQPRAHVHQVQPTFEGEPFRREEQLFEIVLIVFSFAVDRKDRPAVDDHVLQHGQLVDDEFRQLAHARVSL